ncbi:hypothetical protein ZOSMA_77G00630 [Zostera marina]|uniref:Uncharacterized protein n=1 Tax=Zostera marina TaxID=29655 RepID=A0A0K9NQN8_ZOSMR|nr:hypothetical protein ZOSMA_77G00630 [Zostera marina]
MEVVLTSNGVLRKRPDHPWYPAAMSMARWRPKFRRYRISMHLYHQEKDPKSWPGKKHTPPPFHECRSCTEVNGSCNYRPHRSILQGHSQNL